jgi:type II secretory pathway component GspD/PulD (secretin)
MTARTGATGLTFSAWALILAAAGLVVVALRHEAEAQPTPEQVQNMSPEQREQFIAQMRNRRGSGPGAQPAQSPQADGQPKPGDEKKPDEDKGKKDKDEGSATIKRPTEKPKDPADIAKVAPDKPDDHGMVQFEFRGQPWLDVLQWYAGVAGKSFDWQELPGDFLNLSTQRPYTLEETRDLLNSLLMARGFTMIQRGDVLSVVKIDKLDPSFVPRVEADALDDHPPHDIVRTRFPLPPEMDPAKAVEDAKLLLSPTAKVTPLLATRQLQIIDAVGNLRDVRDLINGEQLKSLEDVRPRTFDIQHRRADYIADQVMIVLGLDPAARKNPMELQLEQQRMQLMMQMQQRGADVSKMLKQDGPKVFIAVDKLRNVMLVNAPDAEMKIIERTVDQFDVPQSGVAVAETSPGATPELTMDRYATDNSEAVVTALQEIGALHPLTQLQNDTRADVIFAYATAADHETIKRMISKLDTGGRTPWVIPLNRTMPADQAAGTIQALLVGEKKEDDSSSRRSYYSYYDYYGRGSRDNDEEAEFRVQADVENNRLLLWASETEYNEVHSLLETLGAVSSSKNRLDRLRVLQAGTPEETAKLLERLKETWAGENQLEIDAPAPKEAPIAEPPAPETPAAEPEKAESRDKLTLNPRPRMWLAQYAEGTDAASPADEALSESSEAEAKERPAAPKKAPPVKVTVTEDGRLLLSSDDPEALDQLEELIAELTPPTKDFEVFFLTHADAYDVWWNLKDYFEEELKGQTEATYTPWGDYQGRRKTDTGPTSLGRRRLLRFIYDTPTNSIVVQNASEAQLEVIRELIAIYNKPIGEDSVVQRRTEVIQVQYSRAAPIAAALKEVYRDLLSSKDKEFQSRDGQQRSSRTETYYRIYSGGGESDKKSSPVKVAFEGALSIGVDEISNTLLISAEETVFEKVKELITDLDQRAMPKTVVQVRQVRGSIGGKDLKAALSAALSQPWPGGKPPASAQGQQQNGGGDRDGDRDRSSDGDRRRSRDSDRDND